MITVAAVGTTHPLGIAGLGLDVRAAAQLGARVVIVVAGVSAQDARGVLGRAAVDPATIAAQFAAIRTAAPAAVHVGALLDAAAVRAVADGVRALGVPVVVDPVLAASAAPGATAQLADDDTCRALAHDLLPLATVVTPNHAEAARLLAALGEPDAIDAETAGRRLVARGARAALVTGGDAAGTEVIDVLVQAGGRAQHLGAPRISASLRGTGDLLALALAVRLGAGDALEPAVATARAFVRDAIAHGDAFAGTRALRWDN